MSSLRDEARLFDEFREELEGRNALQSRPDPRAQDREHAPMPATPRERQQVLFDRLRGRAITQHQLAGELGWKWEFITSNMGILNQQGRVRRIGIGRWTAVEP